MHLTNPMPQCHQTHMSHEKNSDYFPGCLRTGSKINNCWKNPHITGQYFIPYITHIYIYPTTTRGFVHCSHVFFFAKSLVLEARFRNHVSCRGYSMLSKKCHWDQCEANMTLDLPLWMTIGQKWTQQKSSPQIKWWWCDGDESHGIPIRKNSSSKESKWLIHVEVQSTLVRWSCETSHQMVSCVMICFCSRNPGMPE